MEVPSGGGPDLRATYVANADRITTWRREHNIEEVDKPSQAYKDHWSYFGDRRALSGCDPGEVYSIEAKRGWFNYQLAQAEAYKLEFEMAKAPYNAAVKRERHSVSRTRMQQGSKKALEAEIDAIVNFEEEYYRILDETREMKHELETQKSKSFETEGRMAAFKERAEEEIRRRITVVEQLDELRAKHSEASYQNTALNAEAMALRKQNAELKTLSKQQEQELAALRAQLARDKRSDYHNEVSAWANEVLAQMHPYLGITLGTHLKKGVFLQHVAPEAAGYASGLRANDIIISINDQETNSKRQVYRMLHGLIPGEVFVVKLLRAGTGFFDVDIHTTTARDSTQFAHEALQLTCRMGAAGCSFSQFLALIRLSRHTKDESIYLDVNTAADFKKDVKLVGFQRAVEQQQHNATSQEQQQR